MTDQERPIIEIEALSKAFSYMPAVRKLDLTIQRGEFVALLGPNGSGKSTLLKLICGLNKPTTGQIRIGGWDMPAEAQAVRAQIGMVSHKALLYDNLTARENLAFFGKLYNLADDGRIERILEKVGLSKRAHSVVRTFSRGMLQRLSIARALLHEPHVLLMDEPYTGLDQDAAAVLDDLLSAAYSDGHTILMATHQLERAARLAKRIIILSRGSIVHDSTSKMETIELAARYAEVTGAATAR